MIENANQIINCPNCKHDVAISIGNKNNDLETDTNFRLGVGGSIHIGIGGHFFVGLNIGELFNRIKEDFRK